jgi:rubredoxin
MSDKYTCELCGWDGTGDEGYGTHTCNPRPKIDDLKHEIECLRAELDNERYSSAPRKYKFTVSHFTVISSS